MSEQPVPDPLDGADVDDAEVGEVEKVPPPKPRFQIRGLAELLDLKPAGQLIDGLLPSPGLAVIYGQPKTMKSFVALSMSLSVAVGAPWFGRKVQQAHVLYVIAEGVGGTPPRARAWLDGLPDEDIVNAKAHFHWLGEPVQLLDSNERKEFCAAVLAMPVRPRMIVIDTLARCFIGGDENEARDMSVFVEAADYLKRECSATVLLVHHCGKEGKTMRGSSALNGAADTVLRVEREQNQVIVKCEAQKDLQEADPIYLEKHSVNVGTDEEGRTLTSCRLAPGDPQAFEKAESLRRTTVKERVLEVLQKSAQGEYFEVRELAKLVKASTSAVQSALKDLDEDGQVKRRRGTVRYCGNDPEGWEDPPLPTKPKPAKDAAADKTTAANPVAGQP